VPHDLLIVVAFDSSRRDGGLDNMDFFMFPAILVVVWLIVVFCRLVVP
jgi:hypothetical protein